ncbi:response regulator transcription factor [Niallia nealsonii]|uniref:DNA-binding response regulator n=1 Tax=Niallia nealsonii TaxID=115979 RepID=A0A2N0YZU2_9BACI|nr:response regulator [Niallia nealsonii]PKG22778.1 DNA-binding response regulator [Niallia nealsonii]
MKIIIVDDEKWTRETIKHFGEWNRLGINVIEEAANGEEGLKLIEKINPEIVITDMKMPGVDGMALLRIVAEKFPQIKLIIASGYNDFHYMRQAILSKANEYLLKPINREELNLALAKCTKEIEDSKKSSLNPFPFLNRDISAFIIKYKKTLASYLSELNANGFKQAIESFFDEFGKMEGINSDAFIKMDHEFIRLLEKEILKNDCTVLEVLEKKASLLTESASSLKALMNKHQELGNEYIATMIDLKSRKNRLNLEEIKEYIDRNYAEPHISLEVLANKFYVSKEYLSKAFKNKYCCNITEYIVRMRMEEAKRLLEENKLQIKSIARMVGYEDISYFYRVFKKYFKISPGEMRKG